MKNPLPKTPREAQAPLSRRKLVSVALAAAASSTALISTPKPALSGTAKETKMTAEKLAELIRRGYHAFNTGDMVMLTELFDANSTWETPGNSPVAGKFDGRDKIFAHFGVYGGSTEGTFKAELMHVVTDGMGNAVGVHRNTGKRQGRTLDTLCCITFTEKNGKVIAGKEHFFDLYNWDAFWA
jgi:uncharacterized protein